MQIINAAAALPLLNSPDAITLRTKQCAFRAYRLSTSFRIFDPEFGYQEGKPGDYIAEHPMGWLVLVTKDEVGQKYELTTSQSEAEEARALLRSSLFSKVILVRRDAASELHGDYWIGARAMLDQIIAHVHHLAKEAE